MIYFLFFIVLFSFSSDVTAQEELASIDITESPLSEDLMGLANHSNPISGQVYPSQLLEGQRIKTSNDLTALDASVTNNYSGGGYWDSLSIRGFAVDNRSNYFRDGLRLNAQTAIALENKEMIEVIKGLGAFQNTGVAPSGAINYRLKRPKQVRDIRLELTERGGNLTHLDIGSIDTSINYRFNAVNEEIKSPFNFNDGYRNLLAAAFSSEISSKSLVEAEIEWSKRSQQSLSAQSFWGPSLPSVHSELNLNNQQWARPVDFESLFYSLRFSQELDSLWFLGLSVGKQNSVTDDRMSYAFGCSQENDWTRFCEDGSFDLYDYRSENEKRVTHAAKMSLNGKIEGSLIQEISLNVRYSHLQEKLDYQSYHFVGVGNQQGRPLPSNAAKNDPSTNLDEETLEFFALDRLRWENWSLWLGGNFLYRYRATWKSDHSEKSSVDNSFFNPWIALSGQLGKRTIYLSYAQSKESWITPNKPEYHHPGSILADQTTQQYELGVKSEKFSSAFFYLQRPRLYDDGQEFRVDGHFQQYGWESNSLFQFKQSSHQLSLMYLRVTQIASGMAQKVAPNIPSFTLRYLGHIDFNHFTLGARVQYESLRYADYDNSHAVADWIKWDFFLEKQMNNLTVKFYIDNAFQKRFWKESPIQYGHQYLYAGQPRRLGILAHYRF